MVIMSDTQHGTSDLTRLRGTFPEWDIWKTAFLRYDTEYHARPSGAPASVVHGKTESEISDRIKQWQNRTQAEIDAHVCNLRTYLDSLPEHWTREREYCNLRIVAESRRIIGKT